MVEISQASSSGRGDPIGEEADAGVVVERREKFSAVCKWQIKEFSKMKQRTTRCLYSRYFEVGGFDCRLLVYPAGDAQALPGYISIYLQVTDPKNATGRWDCFASYRLCVANQSDPSKDIARDSWHRFSAKRKSHGWCDFGQSSIVLDPSTGFAVNDTILVTADILVLSEQTQSVRENESVTVSTNANAEVLSGKFTWKVCNFGLFRDMIKTQKIMSPAFNAGECNLRLSVYQSAVGGTEFLSMCLESKDTDKSSSNERSCWCLFRMSVLSQVQGGRHMHRDSYGRFAADSKTGDNTSLGWNDFMSVAAFTEPEAGYLCNDVATFSASFHIIKESSTFNRSIERGLAPRGRGSRAKGGPSDAFQGKFTWKIEHFTRLKELLKKRKITGLCIKSRRFQVGCRDCRLIVYPRGQSQPPNHLSMFLEVTDSSANNADWSCFVSHRLSVVNQRSDDKSVAKESQNRYSKQAKDWGWREFVTLTSLFDLDAGFLVNDCVVFAAEVLVLRETSELKSLPLSKKQLALESQSQAGQLQDRQEAKTRFSWRIENFVAFKEIMETRKIFSRFFSVEGCDLRIGVYESFDTLCIYLESDAFGSGLERNFWVKYRIAILNQKYPERTEWKEAAICTKTWNNSVLQFMKVTEMVDPDAGYIQRDGLLLACEVVDCQPWFDFADLEVFVSDSEAESLSTDPEEILDSDDSDVLTPEEEDTFRSLLGDAGLHVVGAEAGSSLDMHDLQQVLSDKMHLDSDAAASFVAGLHLYMDDDPYKIKRLLQPGQAALDGREPGICLFDLLMGVEVLQAPLLDLLLDVLIQLCHQQPKARPAVPKTRRQPAYTGLDTTASLADAYARFNLESREDGECASSSAALPTADAHASKMPNGNDSSSSGTVTPQEPPSSSDASHDHRNGHAFHNHSNTSHAKPLSDNNNLIGNHLAWLSGREKAEELIMIAFRWLATVDQFMCLRSRSSKGRTGPFTLQKVQNLLAALPRPLQPQLVLLVPKLVSPVEHTTAAGILLAKLAEASREGLEAEQELRLPVLSALGLLSIESAAAEKVLNSALGALPALSDSELAPAVGLILKLASESQGLRGQAVHVVRQKARSCPEVAAGSLDAIRLAVTQHEDIATAMLTDIDNDCRQAKPATNTEGNARDAHGGSCPEALQVVDLEVLLDLLRNPSFAEKARAVIERAVLRGLLSDVTMAVALEQRKIRLMSNEHLHQHYFPDYRSDPSAPMDQTSGLRQTLHQPDDSEAVLGVAESMASSKSTKLKLFAAVLYQTVFRVTSEESRRGLMLRALIARAAQSSACQPGSAKESRGASSGAASARSSSGQTASSARTPRSEAGQASEGRPEVDVTTPEGLLLTLISQYPGAAKPAVILMMLEAQAASAKAAAVARKLQESEHGQDKALKDAKASAAKHQAEAEAVTQRLNNAESEKAELRQDHATEAAGFASARRELEERVRNLERELDWVHGEREEEQAAVAQERRETAGRMRELEATSNRMKSARKDDMKRVSRERAQALERCKELEASNQRLEGEVRRLGDSASASTATLDSLHNRIDEMERSAKVTAQEHDKQVSGLNESVKGLQAACGEHQQHAAHLESQLREEVAKSAPLHGLNLDRLTATQLDNLVRLHERGLKQAKALQGQKRSEESAAATALAAANAVTGGPPPRQLNFPRGMPVPQALHSNSSIGSGDSMMSLAMDPPISASLRNLQPADRAPGTAQLTSARSVDRPNGAFVSNGPQGLQRSMTPGIASYYNQNAGLTNGGFPQANATLPNGFPNGLLSGTGLLNGQQQKGNGTHKLW